MRPLLRRIGIELPIIQAPVAGVSTPEMANTVSNAGTAFVACPESLADAGSRPRSSARRGARRKASEAAFTLNPGSRRDRLFPKYLVGDSE